jgi:asparagine synthase (glutamine-hydrolysing)
VCGICGKLSFDRDRQVSPDLVKSMADMIQHRGPDDEGFYVSGPVGLGFRRLSIIDLQTGHQPLSNEDGTVWIVFNGEIYNYKELRAFLESKGHVFKTHTDTEVIVHLYEEMGEKCVGKLRGMFAFAIWDGRNEALFIARDRVGIKPLYYWLSDRCLVFASEIKSLLVDPEVKAELAPEMIDRFLTFYYVPGEETLLRNIFKLAPGSYMFVRNGKAEIKQYWDLEFVPRERSLEDAESELLSLLDECVRMHMVSDVPVGFLLSGGVDSTAMLGMAVGKTDHRLSSFTLGFSEPGLADERPYARLAAKTYDSDHHEMTITAQEFADFVPKFAWYMEEPVCEPQAIALYYVTRLAKNYVKVLISGEGGDEAFAGYPIYRNVVWMERLKRALGPFSGVLSSIMSIANKRLRSPRISKYAPLFGMPFPSYFYSRTSGPSRFFNLHTEELYTSDFFRHVDRNLSKHAVQRYMDGNAKSVVNTMLYADTKSSLPDDLLLKADKMTMANSVELRVPFLDHKFLEFAAALPDTMKVHGLTTKYVAKTALKNRVPHEILHRKKVGFPVPYERWMRTDLKDWVRDILLDSKTVSRGYFNRSCIEQLIDEDLRLHNHPKEILSLVSLELWHRAFLRENVQSAASSSEQSPALVPVTR